MNLSLPHRTMMDDLSARRILIIEEEDDRDLDQLLFLGDTSGVGAPSSPPSPKSVSPSSSTPLSSSSFENNASSSSPAAATTAVASPSPPSHVTPILASEEERDGDDDGLGHWVLPAPALPGDYLNGSLHRVPSKSILKKVSSYGNFDSSRGGGSSTGGRTRRLSIALDSSSTSQASGSIRGGGRFHNRSQVSDEPPFSSLLSADGSTIKSNKKTSFLSLTSLDSNQGQPHNQGGEQIGWDLEDDGVASSPMYRGITMAEDESLPSIPNSHDALDSSTKMRRNVSFHAVDVREYDRTVGDHPGCRSGPPLSLDWSYSKKYQKNLDEFELERNSHRVSHYSELHMSKYKRRNLLAFQWGHSVDELKEARDNTKKMQRQRNVTQLLQPVHMAEERIIDFKNFFARKTSKKKQQQGGRSEMDDWSDMSNSISTKDSSHLGIRSINMLNSPQDSGGLPSSSHTT